MYSFPDVIQSRPEDTDPDTNPLVTVEGTDDI